ncbi:MAG: hypothetical protein M3Q97_06220, partial [Bacteroidota bacterium]|nr:hypothetical protein [Bacteroidota bacterium]
MKKLMLIIFLTLPALMSAQDEPSRKELDALRVGVYSRVLTLTPEEAQKFWPVFNLFHAEMEVLRKEERTIRQNIGKNRETLSDAELDKEMVKLYDIRQKQLDLERKYYGEFKKVLPMK